MSLASRWKSGRTRVDQPGREWPSVDDLPAAEFVDLAYQVVLGRKPEPEELRHHAASLTEGKTDRRRLIAGLTRCDEIKAIAVTPPDLTDEEFVRSAYRVILARPATESEVTGNADRIRSGATSRSLLVQTLFHSRECKANNWAPMDFWMALHRSRLLVASQLPKAERIVDLGGSSEGNPEGALLVYGYPYHFKGLSIVELPREARHELYTEICGEYDKPIDTPQGPVNYVYASMTDLSSFADGTIDLVYSGQSIEHVTTDEALTVIRQVHRILKPGGHFCFDTPNRAVTQFGFPDYIVDDHKYEYTHQEMSGILEGNGFAVIEAKGLVLLDNCVRTGQFDAKEAINRDRFYDDIEDCFLLYYKARKV